MREIASDEMYKALSDLLAEEKETEELPDDLEEAVKRIKESLEKPDVEAVLVFPTSRRHFPIPPRKL